MTQILLLCNQCPTTEIITISILNLAQTQNITNNYSSSSNTNLSLKKGLIAAVIWPLFRTLPNFQMRKKRGVESIAIILITTYLAMRMSSRRSWKLRGKVYSCISQCINSKSKFRRSQRSSCQYLIEWAKNKAIKCKIRWIIYPR